MIGLLFGAITAGRRAIAARRPLEVSLNGVLQAEATDWVPTVLSEGWAPPFGFVVGDIITFANIPGEWTVTKVHPPGFREILDVKPCT
jgi:hypothetical protein